MSIFRLDKKNKNCFFKMNSANETWEFLYLRSIFHDAFAWLLRKVFVLSIRKGRHYSVPHFKQGKN